MWTALKPSTANFERYILGDDFAVLSSYNNLIADALKTESLGVRACDICI